MVSEVRLGAEAVHVTQDDDSATVTVRELGQERRFASGRRLPNPLLRSADGEAVHLYDMLPAGAALLDVSDESQPAPDAPVDEVIRVGAGGHHDFRRPPGAAARRGGWILVRPDTHIAWARPRRKGITGPVRQPLGNPG